MYSWDQPGMNTQNFMVDLFNFAAIIFRGSVQFTMWHGLFLPPGFLKQFPRRQMALFSQWLQPWKGCLTLQSVFLIWSSLRYAEVVKPRKSWPCQGRIDLPFFAVVKCQAPANVDSIWSSALWYNRKKCHKKCGLWALRLIGFIAVEEMKVKPRNIN